MNLIILLIPVGLQVLATLVDEFYFHHRRRLPRWERLGHPADTLSVLLCYVIVWTSPPTNAALLVYVSAGFFSCILVTKDEFIHADRCTPLEHWLHALLFVLHPMVLAAIGWLWITAHMEILAILGTLTSTFFLYQAVYWNTPWATRAAPK